MHGKAIGEFKAGDHMGVRSIFMNQNHILLNTVPSMK
jgi:hypothetical protein